MHKSTVYIYSKKATEAHTVDCLASASPVQVPWCLSEDYLPAWEREKVSMSFTFTFRVIHHELVEELAGELDVLKSMRD